MEKVILKMSDVSFDANTHTYLLYGQPLKGVTPIVKWMFPDTYRGIPDDVLKKAADHGNLIHSKIEMYDTMGIVDDECLPLKDYISLMEKAGMKAHLSEYLVDDGQNIASSIDKVFERDEEGRWPLGDIKTTSQVHIPNVTLQLSIYAWLFEMCNPGQKAGRLYEVWLPKPQYGKADLIEVERIPSDICEKIVKAYLNGEESNQFQDMFNIGKVRKGSEGELPFDMKDIAEELKDIISKEKELGERKEALKGFLMNEMVSEDVSKWTYGNLTITRKSGGVRQSVDSKKLKEEHPDIYAECVKTTNFKESIELKMK